jgi:hypothetical protein
MRPRVLVPVLAAGLLLAALLLTSPVQPAAAQTAPSSRIRGTIETVDPGKITVKTRSGETMNIALTEPLTVLTVRKLEVAAIEPGSYVGIATRNGPGGVMQAIEVLVFPEQMRGASEGFFAWDLEPGSMMTNGTVKGVVTGSSARQLTVAYKEGSKIIDVAPSAPVVTFAPAEKADVKAGAPVFLSATKTPAGTLTTGRLVVGTNGVAPPM